MSSALRECPLLMTGRQAGDDKRVTGRDEVLEVRVSVFQEACLSYYPQAAEKPLPPPMSK